MQAQKQIGLDDQHLNRELLLKDFAFSIALNNPFIFDVSFFLDQRYLPGTQKILKFSDAQVPSNQKCESYQISRYPLLSDWRKQITLILVSNSILLALKCDC